MIQIQSLLTSAVAAVCLLWFVLLTAALRSR